METGASSRRDGSDDDLLDHHNHDHSADIEEAQCLLGVLPPEEEQPSPPQQQRNIEETLHPVSVTNAFALPEEQQSQYETETISTSGATIVNVTTNHHMILNLQKETESLRNQIEEVRRSRICDPTTVGGDTPNPSSSIQGLSNPQPTSTRTTMSNSSSRNTNNQDKNNDASLTINLSEDTYSLMKVSTMRSWEFLLAFSVFVIQIVLYILIFTQQTKELTNTKNDEEVKIPIWVDNITFVGQFFAILLAILVNKDLFTSINTGRSNREKWEQSIEGSGNEFSICSWWLSIVLQAL